MLSSPNAETKWNDIWKDINYFMELFVSSKANTQCVWLLCGDILYNLSILFSKLDLFIEKASIGEWHIGLNS